MRNLLLALTISVVSLGSFGIAAHADDAMKNGKYCMTNTSDPLCMDDKMFKMREEMMKMKKEDVMASRTKYCEEHASDNDPICTKEMMESTKGF